MNKIEKLKCNADLPQAIATLNQLIDAWNNEFDKRTKTIMNTEFESGLSKSGGKHPVSPFTRKP